MAKYRVHKVYTDIVEANSKEEAEKLFSLENSSEDFILDVIELDENGEEI
jgi:hypothetical protein